MTYTEKELDQFLHGISLSLLSKKSAQHWRYDEETAKEIEWLEALERKVRADKADHKTESNSEKPNNCEPKICDTCRYYNSNIPCGSTPSACKEADKFAKEFVEGLKKLKPKVEPQTDTEIAKAIVHKMIDDAVLAEDAYPDLRQKMHDAVDEYEPQTERTTTEQLIEQLTEQPQMEGSE